MITNTLGLVGRTRELKLLERLLSNMNDGAAAVAVLGEPGIGKTRLLEAFYVLAGKRGLLVLEGRATEFERDAPFGLLVDALDDHLETLGSRRTPLLLVLDDLHWADEASVALLAHLLRHPPRGSVLIVLAYRTKQVPAQLRAALEASLRDAAQVHEIGSRPWTSRRLTSFWPHAGSTGGASARSTSSAAEIPSTPSSWRGPAPW